MQTGIDTGLSCTALVTLDDDGKILYKKDFGFITSLEFKKVAKKHPAERYGLYIENFRGYFNDNNITGTIVIEEPRGTFQGHSIKLAELKGIYLGLLYDLKFDYNKIYMPEAGTIKFFLTGYGKADKIDIINELTKRGYKPKHDHEADAIAMALMSCTDHLNYVYN